ncbi:MAG TPA: response regulator, partial [Candidatus Hydrogenedentes bacterium]|nr:response regulator [Candidatus Hydrogenedentota bacterium]
MTKARNREKILVVDDSEATLEVLQRNLEAANYAVTTASSVAEALSLLETNTMDLVITDF